MGDFINKFKIPTLLGLGIIILGIISGLYLILREQIFLSQATPNLTAQNITVTNITDSSAVVSWQTNIETPSFLTFGQNNPGEQTVRDDRDTTNPKPYFTHYVTLKNLLPQTKYQFKIISGKVTSEVKSLETAKPLTNKLGLTPIIGSVLDGNTPLSDAIAFLSITDATPQSTLIKSGGNFLIPLASIRKADLSDSYPLAETTTAKITVTSNKGSATVTFKLQNNSTPLPPFKLGDNLDLTAQATPAPSQITIEDLDKYDLNKDGKVNAADYAIISGCIGKKVSASSGGISCGKADFDKNGKIEQKDLDLIPRRIKDLGTQ